MNYISPDNEYPRFISDIELAHPDFDGINLPEGWHEVHESAPIPKEPNQYVTEDFPQMIDGKYYRNYVLHTWSPEQYAAIESKREELKQEALAKHKSTEE
jgi:hypothetical protein